MDARKKSLDEQLADLPRDIAPPGQLWPGVLAGITRRQRPRPLAYAALAACALLASALTWALLRAERTVPSATTTAATSPGALLPHEQWPAARAPNFAEPADPAYLAARAELESTFHERLKLLSPDTRAKIESNLAVIRQAHENIRKALAAEPANPVLEQLFESTWHEEFDLYDRVVRTTQPESSRT